MTVGRVWGERLISCSSGHSRRSVKLSGGNRSGRHSAAAAADGSAETAAVADAQVPAASAEAAASADCWCQAFSSSNCAINALQQSGNLFILRIINS